MHAATAPILPMRCVTLIRYGLGFASPWLAAHVAFGDWRNHEWVGITGRIGLRLGRSGMANLREVHAARPQPAKRTGDRGRAPAAVLPPSPRY